MLVCKLKIFGKYKIVVMLNLHFRTEDTTNSLVDFKENLRLIFNLRDLFFHYYQTIFYIYSLNYCHIHPSLLSAAFPRNFLPIHFYLMSSSSALLQNKLLLLEFLRMSTGIRLSVGAWPSSHYP